MLRATRLLALFALAARGHGVRFEGGTRVLETVALCDDVVRHTLSFLPPLVAFCPGTEEVEIYRGTRSRRGWPSVRLRHGFPVSALSFFPTDARLMAVGLSRVVVWDAWEGRSLASLDHGPSVFHAQIFPDGKRLITIGSDRQAAVWSTASWEALSRWDVGHPHHCVLVVGGGSLVVTGVGDSNASEWNVVDGKHLRELQHPEEKVLSLEASPCGKRVGAAGYRHISVWDVATGGLQHRFDRPQEAEWLHTGRHRPLGFALSEDAAIVVGRGVMNAFVWDGRSGELVRTLELGDIVTSLLPLPDGKRVLAFTVSGASVLDLRSGASVGALEALGVTAAATASDGSDVVAACAEAWAFIGQHGGGGGGQPDMWQIVRKMLLWDVSTGHVLRAHRESPLVLADGESDYPCSVALGAVQHVQASAV